VNGFDIAFTYHLRRAGADKLMEAIHRKGCEAQAFHLDLNDIEQVRGVVERANEKMGAIDSLIIASGIATGLKQEDRVPKYFEITPQEYDKMMIVNVRGVFFACQEAARIMASGSGGRIVIIGSIDGIKPVPSPGDYACCKGALWGMTQALSKELGKHGILVNMVAPGILEGGIADLLSEDLMKEYLKHCSLKRVGTFSEIAKMIAFLAGHKNTYLTGQAVILDGGL